MTSDVGSMRPRRREQRQLGVGQLIRGLQGLLDQRVGRVFVVGEISNLHEARSGHAYFTLKDEEGQIRCALFRGAARSVRFALEEGLVGLTGLESRRALHEEGLLDGHRAQLVGHRAAAPRVE